MVMMLAAIGNQMLTKEKELSLENLGAFIKQLRKKKGLTQIQLAELANSDDSYIGRLENGTQLGSPQSLIAIAIALDVEPGILLNILADYSEDRIPVYLPKILTPEDHEQITRFVTALEKQRMYDSMPEEQRNLLAKENTAQKESTQRILNKPPKTKGK